MHKYIYTNTAAANLRNLWQVSTGHAAAVGTRRRAAGSSGREHHAQQHFGLPRWRRGHGAAKFVGELSGMGDNALLERLRAAARRGYFRRVSTAILV